MNTESKLVTGAGQLQVMEQIAASERIKRAVEPKPVGYMAFGTSDEGQDVPLYDYAGFSEDEVRRKIVLTAQYQGYKGDMADHIKALGWTIRPIFS